MSIDQDYVIELSADKLFDFLEITGSVSKLCEDITIKDGYIRQVSDKKTSMVVCDVGSAVGITDLYLSKAVSKTELLDPFKRQRVSVTLKKSEGEYSIFDEYSKITFKIPNPKYLSNSYTTDSDMKGLLNIDEHNDLIFEKKFERMLVERLNSTSKTLAAQSLEIQFLDNKANFNLSSGDTDGLARGTIISVPVDTDSLKLQDYVSRYPIIPFLLGNDIEVKAFISEEGSNKRLILKITSNIGTSNNKIDLTTWNIASLYNPNDLT